MVFFMMSRNLKFMFWWDSDLTEPHECFPVCPESFPIDFEQFENDKLYFILYFPFKSMNFPEFFSILAKIRAEIVFIQTFKLLGLTPKNFGGYRREYSTREKYVKLSVVPQRTSGPCLYGNFARIVQITVELNGKREVQTLF